METIIYSKKLANELVDYGFKLIRTEINVKFPQFFVFIFEKTNELEKYLKIKKVI